MQVGGALRQLSARSRRSPDEAHVTAPDRWIGQGFGPRILSLAACAEATRRASRSRRAFSSLESWAPGAGGADLPRRSSCGSASRAAGPRLPRPATIRSRTARLVPSRGSASAREGTAGGRGPAGPSPRGPESRRSSIGAGRRARPGRLPAAAAPAGRDRAWRIPPTSAPALDREPGVEPRLAVVAAQEVAPGGPEQGLSLEPRVRLLDALVGTDRARPLLARPVALGHAEQRPGRSWDRASAPSRTPPRPPPPEAA